MLENPDCLRYMVKKSGAQSTDLESLESVEHLCSKCDAYAENWKDPAAQLWKEEQNSVREKEC